MLTAFQGIYVLYPVEQPVKLFLRAYEEQHFQL